MGLPVGGLNGRKRRASPPTTERLVSTELAAMPPMANKPTPQNRAMNCRAALPLRGRQGARTGGQRTAGGLV